jgi:hypothetical protein
MASVTAVYSPSLYIKLAFDAGLFMTPQLHGMIVKTNQRERSSRSKAKRHMPYAKIGDNQSVKRLTPGRLPDVVGPNRLCIDCASRNCNRAREMRIGAESITEFPSP